MSDEKKERKVTISKDKFLAVAIPAFKKAGVVFKKGDRVSQSSAEYWNLVKLSQAILVAASAAGGTPVSLAGVGTCRFSESGRTPETRCKRFKYKASSSVQKIFAENRDLVSDTNLAEQEDAFSAKFTEVLSALGFGDEPAEEIIADNTSGEVL